MYNSINYSVATPVNISDFNKHKDK